MIKTVTHVSERVLPMCPVYTAKQDKVTSCRAAPAKLFLNVKLTLRRGSLNEAHNVSRIFFLFA